MFLGNSTDYIKQEITKHKKLIYLLEIFQLIFPKSKFFIIY